MTFEPMKLFQKYEDMMVFIGSNKFIFTKTHTSIVDFLKCVLKMVLIQLKKKKKPIQEASEV